MNDPITDRSNQIAVYGARVHNLKNIDVVIPRNKLVVITGLSGSGKSSLAFDTIYSEGQRRYIETFPNYARQFLGILERPDVDRIEGLSPVISIEQKTVNKNPRSTVGTITEIYDFLRLLFAKISDAYSPVTGKKMVKFTEDQIINLLIERHHNQLVYILSPVVRGRKGHYRELFEQMRLKGFLSARIDGIIRELTPGLKIDRYSAHNIEIVIDKIVVKENDHRLKNSIKTALQHGKGVVMITKPNSDKTEYLSKNLMCPESGISFDEPQPNTFSFNLPTGYCPKCKGLGEISEFDQAKIFPNLELSISQGAIVPLGKYKNSVIFWQIEALCHKYQCTINTPLRDFPDDLIDEILYGTDHPIKLQHTPLGSLSEYAISFPGIIEILNQQAENDDKSTQHFVKTIVCPDCHGTRLNQQALQFKIDGMNIAQLSSMDIAELAEWFQRLPEKLTAKQMAIATDILKEINNRLQFLLNVGLSYLSLNRSSRSLSGGESQRIRLATQIGSKLVNVLYILDEPSIGLHQSDNLRLIESLKALRDSNNSVIVVEHDREMIESADYIVDIGPGAGIRGGEICAAGSLSTILESKSLTAKYLSGELSIPVPQKRRKGNGKTLTLVGCTGHNLKNVDVSIPLGMLVCVTGVSGSGKSSLINQTLHPILNAHFFNALATPLPYKSIEGLENIDKVIEIDQAPLGRTPRSNPATYTNIFTHIRNLFAQTPEAQIRGYNAGRFSFNVKGGRCETCKGSGVEVIEMNFLPDVYVQCKTCRGQRYNRETLEVRYKGKNINDVLEMTINQASKFFDNFPKIKVILETLQKVGLGYLKLGQPSTTLSGGESQRVKLAAELARPSTGKTLYILDEPTTGLHFEDIRLLLNVLNNLVDKGNSVIVIEHNMDVIKTADYIIDLGPLGGRNGGEIVACGTPEQIANNPRSLTGKFLKKELSQNCH
ncbi:MAG TPA: excinuclease ABC subunit UvrA [Salinivirgaceae bacterium]|mgnify:CR=1 FL=1|nr:excinuclease ABC subunit UvrA [Salinivirgaceae bacterium]